MTLSEELRAFNDERKARYGGAPRPDKPLPLPATGKGGDVMPLRDER